MATARINDSNMVVILINQIRKDLGSFFVKDIAVGGNALEHAKSLDIFLRRTKKADWPEDGHKINATLLKSTHTMAASEGDVIELNFFKGRGFDNEYDIVQTARECSIFKESGKSKYTYVDKEGNEHSISGKKADIDSNLKQYCIDNDLIGELTETLASGNVENVGEVEKIELDEEAESVED